jgi:hypothetical protein
MVELELVCGLLQAQMETRSIATVKESLEAQIETLREENYLLRQRVVTLPTADTPVDVGALTDTPAAARGPPDVEIQLLDVQAALKSAQVEVQWLQKEVVSRKGDVTHFEAMSAEFENNWKAAEERLKAERHSYEVCQPLPRYRLCTAVALHRHT